MSSPQAKPENMLLNLVCNIVVPTVVLTNLSAEKRLGPLWALIVAIAFPVAYGVYDLATRKKTNVLSILGFISVLVSGCLALGKVGGLGFAVKDAVLPLVFGAAVLLTLRTKSPLVRTMFFNESIMDVARVEAALDERNQRENLNRIQRRARQDALGRPACHHHPEHGHDHDRVLEARRPPQRTHRPDHRRDLQDGEKVGQVG